jgi:hypothetical protein
MSYRSEVAVHKVTLLSKRILLSWIITTVIDGLVGGATILLGIRWKLMEIIAIVLFGFAALLLTISWTAPGIFIILRVPWLARAWLRGINPILIPDKPWEQLSGGEKFAVYFHAIVFFVFTLGIVVGLIIQSVRK